MIINSRLNYQGFKRHAGIIATFIKHTQHLGFNFVTVNHYLAKVCNGFCRFNKDIRVVVEGAEFADYFWPAMEQLVERMQNTDECSDSDSSYNSVEELDIDGNNYTDESDYDSECEGEEDTD